MPIKNYTTRIPAVQTVGEIQGILAAHGARKVMMDYAENGKVTAVTFALECCGPCRGSDWKQDRTALKPLWNGSASSATMSKQSVSRGGI